MSRAQRSPSRAPSTANNKDTTTNAALLGALLAFGGASKSNGDLVRSRGSSPNVTPGSSLRRKPPASTSSSHFTAPAVTTTTATAQHVQRERADTHRSTPPPLKPKPRRLSEHHYKPQPISPTTSFVGTLEHNSLRSPIPRLNPDASRKPVGGMDLRDQAQASSLERGDDGVVQKKAAQLQQRQARSGAGYTSREVKDPQIQGQSQPPKSQRLEGGTRARAQSMSSDEEYVSASEAATTVDQTGASKQRTADRNKRPPTPPPTRSRHRPNSHSVSAGPTQPIDIARSPRQFNSSVNSSVRSISTHSNPSVSAAYHQLYPRHHRTPLTLGEDLANAMVASSLATSRASSPSKTAISPPSQRRHSYLSPFHSRNPSPTKSSKPPKKVGMRHTLRDPETSSSESEIGQHPYGKHKKKRHLRPKHPNKHHEGDRKRWRDAVTERERKRYEGLFASNRGLHLPPSMPNNISNIVVRDLWMRSRLPRSELETIWNLVAVSEPGKPPPPAQTSLNKEQFVVGLWLIDQRLKGRKLPIRVSETVWASVKGLQGIKVKKFLG